MNKNRPDPNDTEKWNDLLNKFYNGETSTSEEKQLRGYLWAKTEKDTHFRADKAVFAYIEMKKTATKHKHIPIKLYRILKVSVAAATLAGVIVYWSYLPTDTYVAYVHGKKYTRPDVVKQQMENTLKSLQITDISVEKQLSDIFVKSDSNL